MRTPIAGSLLLLSLAGCASMRATTARDTYLEAEMRAWIYPKSCQAIWPDVLRQLASGGYSLVGTDRIVAGEKPQGSVAGFFSEGFETRETYDGGLVVQTDWNRSWVRYRANGTVAGNGCKMTFTRETRPDTDDPGRLQSSSDWEMALGLLRRVDPAAGARVEAGIPKGST